MSDRAALPRWPQRSLIAVAATATVALAGQQTSRIFASGYPFADVIACCVIGGLVGLITAPLPVWLRIAGVAVSGVAAGAAVVARFGGDLPGDLLTAITSGVGDLIAALWPVPPLPTGLAAISIAVALAAATAVGLAVRGAASAGLLPSLALVGLTALLAAEAGPPPAWWLSLYVISCFVLLRSVVPSPRSIVTLAVSVVMLVFASSVPFFFESSLAADRFDPRDRLDASAQPESDVSPLARLDEWRSFDPPTVMFATDAATVSRWRLVGLTRYDGLTWSPADDYRRAGSRFEPADDVDPEIVRIAIEELDSPWIPMLDRTITISVDVRVDGTMSGLYPGSPSLVGNSYELGIVPQQVPPAELAQARVQQPMAPFVDEFELSPSLLQLASDIVAGAQTDFERANSIATYLRERYNLDPSSPPGHSIGVLEVFLERTRQGRDEQFVAAYGLLAAAVGLPVRIAVGFETTPDPAGPGTVALSIDAEAWPEVGFDGLGWVRFNPVPAPSAVGSGSVGDDAIAPVERPDLAAPPTTVAPTADELEPADVVVDPVEPVDESGFWTGTLIGLGAGLIVVLCVAAYVSGVLWWKARRRRRRLRAPDPAERTVAAFRASVDVMVDLGLDAQPSSTDRELVTVGATVVGDSAEMLQPLAAMATAAVFAPDLPSPSTADAAWREEASFERLAATHVGRIRHLRSRMSMRSLRRSSDE